jgi:inorganic pyrophosphatase
MSQRNLLELPAFERTTTNLTVIVESPRGSSTKLKYNPATDAFELSYILPAGSTFPFEFGFIPSTLGEDGDHSITSHLPHRLPMLNDSG